MSKSADNIDKYRSRAKVKTDAGFTFVEVVIALAIVSISLVSLIRLHIININTVDSARMISSATQIAQDRIAEMSAIAPAERKAEKGIEERANAVFDWQVTVEEADIPQWQKEDTAGLKKITVKVSWRQGAGKKQIRMSTYLSDRELL